MSDLDRYRANRIEQVKAEEYAQAWGAVRRNGTRADDAVPGLKSASERFGMAPRGSIEWLRAGIALQRAHLVLRHAVILEECGGGS